MDSIQPPSGGSNTGNVIENFRAAMRKEGIHVTGELIADGKLHRYYVDGDKARTVNGWAIIHLDAHPAGMFGCNKRHGSHKFRWSMSGARPLTPSERKTLKAESRARAGARAAEDAIAHQAAADEALAIYQAARPVTSHPYLTRKGVKPCDKLRVGNWYWTADDGRKVLVSDQALIVPLMDPSKKIHTLQAIFPDSENILHLEKIYLRHGVKAGHFMSIGQPVDKTILICEGVATGLSLHQCTGHAVIVAFDAGNLMAVGKEARRARPGYRLLFCGDNDAWTESPLKNPGQHYASRAALELGATWVLPAFLDNSNKPTDFNDLHQLEGESAVKDAIDHALARDATPRSGERPQIVIADGSRHLIVDRTEELVALRDDIYQNAGRIVRVITALEYGATKDNSRQKGDGVGRNYTDPRRLLMGTVSSEWLRTELTRDIDWFKYSDQKKDLILKDAPDYIAAALIENGMWRTIRHLRGITSAPIIRPDGTIHLEAGYDSGTGMLLSTSERFLPIIEGPTIDDAKKALDVLKKPFKYYRFSSDAGLATALSLVLTRLTRHLLPRVPFHLVTAPAPGSGKGEIIEVAEMICSGVRASLRPWPEDDEDELRKVLTSCVMASQGLVCFDNIPNGAVIRSPTLDAFLTATIWEDRMLGHNKNIHAPNNLVLAGTGNNVQFSRDSIRRVIVARILTDSEKPWTRTFEWTPSEFAERNRLELLHAACTLILAFIQTGAPAPEGIVPLGSFGEWSKLVRNALKWVGMADPCSTQEDFLAADTERARVGCASGKALMST